MTRQQFIEKYGLSIYLGPEGEIDSRSVIWLATSNLSDVQQTLRYGLAERGISSETVALNRINDVKEFLFDWNRVLKAEEQHFASYSQRFEEEEMQP